MKPLNYLKALAIFMATLIVMLPVTFAEEFNRVYDANGNLISDGKYYREYNGLNQLIKVRLGNISTSPVLEEYLWHPIEERIVVKRVFYNGVYNYTVYYPTKEFVRIVNSSGTFDERYVYQDGVLVAQIDTNGNKQFIHSDHEGSNTLITDINGNIVENTFYSPYGEIIEGGKSSRKDYEGKEYDSLVEDYDFGFRKFDLSIPIGNQPDTLIPNVYDPQSLNRYAFERNNPQKNIDEDGHLYQSLSLLGWVGGVLLILSVLAYITIFISQGKDKGIDTDTKIANNPKYNQQIDNIQQEANEGKNVAYIVNEGTFVPDAAKEQLREMCESEFVNCGDSESDNLEIKPDVTLEDEVTTIVNVEEEDDEKPTSSSGGKSSSSGGNPGYWATCTEVCTKDKCKWVCTT